MRASTRRVLTLGVVAATALAWSGCDAKKQTEFVTGVSTQVKVPRDLKAIRVDVSVGGVIKFCQGYRVYDGKVQLPRSLGEFPTSGTPGADPVTITVSGFTEEFSESSDRPVFSDCPGTAPRVGDKDQPNTRILRRSRQPYVADSIVFLPMPLKYSCFDKDCSDDTKTCKAGLCVDARIDETKLPRFSEELLSGLGGACFKASACFATSGDALMGFHGEGVPAAVVDPNDCTYALPGTSSAPPVIGGMPIPADPAAVGGINVQVTYDGGYNSEVLDKDPEEGFTIPDPTKPQRFRLAPGLCDMVKGFDKDGVGTKHRVTAIRVTGSCQAKTPFQPLCAEDQLAAMGVVGGASSTAGAPLGCAATELKPAPSALMVLADDTDNMKIFYDSVDDKLGLSISLGDPAFRATDIGLTYFPGTAASCSGFDNAVPFRPALAARDTIFASFEAKSASGNAALVTTTEDVGLGPAIADAAAKLAAPKYATANRRAILVIGNRGFDDASTTCTPKPIAAATAARTAGVETYVTMLARDPDAGGSAEAPLPAPVPGADAVAAAGSPSTLATPLAAYDARAAMQKGRAQDAFRRIVEDLATCAYDVSVPLGSDDVLSYSDPVATPPTQATTFTIPPAAAGTCTKAGDPGNGWGIAPGNPTRVHVCGAKCDEYKGALKKASDWGLLYKQPSLAVPVFAHKKTCAPTP